MTILVTGAAGFIGFHLARRLLEAGESVVGLDSMTDYYDVSLKQRRVALLAAFPRFTFARQALEDHAALDALFAERRPGIVHHLAAQAGVRYSIEAPRAYLQSNLVGAFNLLEACRRHPPRHLMLASTSSAYGANEKHPFVETDAAVHPITLYAATKGSMELMAHAYAHLYEVPTTAFRFFTVYGPWGRPDMAYFKFTRAILAGEPIDLYNHGACWRDFTFIDDLVDSIVALSELVPPAPAARAGLAPVAGDTLSPVAPYRLVNIGPGAPVKLADFVDALERALGARARRRLLPLPPGDMERTYASAELLQALTGSKPQTPLDEGLRQFVAWWRAHMN